MCQRLREFLLESYAVVAAGRKENKHNKTENFFTNQNPKKLVKQTKTSRTTVLALNCPILRKNEANIGKNYCVKIYTVGNVSNRNNFLS